MAITWPSHDAITWSLCDYTCSILLYYIVYMYNYMYKNNIVKNCNGYKSQHICSPQNSTAKSTVPTISASTVGSTPALLPSFSWLASFSPTSPSPLLRSFFLLQRRSIPAQGLFLDPTGWQLGSSGLKLRKRGTWDRGKPCTQQHMEKQKKTGYNIQVAVGEGRAGECWEFAAAAAN